VDVNNMSQSKEMKPVEEIDESYLPVINDFINYNKKVGPLQAIEVGYPGSGKSSHATSIVINCHGKKEEKKKSVPLCMGMCPVNGAIF
jgi:hypothetical protein